MKSIPRFNRIVTAVALLTAASAQAFFDPHIGRWASRDPVGEPGFQLLPADQNAAESPSRNPFAFVSNDPVDNMDPFGLAAPGAAVPPTPKFATRSVKTQKATSNWGIYQVLIIFDLAITDASNKAVPGVTVGETISIIQRHRLLSGPPTTGSGVTDSKGMVTDTYYATFCGSSGYVSLRQTLSVAALKADFYTRINAPGTWSGNLRSVFH